MRASVISLDGNALPCTPRSMTAAQARTLKLLQMKAELEEQRSFVEPLGAYAEYVKRATEEYVTVALAVM